ncbi:hypothetical protein [Hymenobacter norwichensis]|uniref:hypothetical protein n=1 Tax=Hymenobacter norwichensis TaxID=223903 RepID=UPI0003B5D5B1|nr:hypothetical protein [Hymenobacter norwichensis]
MKTQPTSKKPAAQTGWHITDPVQQGLVHATDSTVLPGERNQEYIPVLPHYWAKPRGLRFGPQDTY